MTPPSSRAMPNKADVSDMEKLLENVARECLHASGFNTADGVHTVLRRNLLPLLEAVKRYTDLDLRQMAEVMSYATPGENYERLKSLLTAPPAQHVDWDTWFCKAHKPFRSHPLSNASPIMLQTNVATGFEPPWDIANWIATNDTKAKLITTKRENEDDEETVAFVFGPTREAQEATAKFIVETVNRAAPPAKGTQQE